MESVNLCPLCQNSSLTLSPPLNNLKLCSVCGLAFKETSTHLTHAEERKRYLLHQNHLMEDGYKKYLQQLVNPALELGPEPLRALDYGCGPFPALSLILREKSIVCENYDPYFFPHQVGLESKFDLIFCSEVVEHFRNPALEWQKLIQLLSPHGRLAVMTKFHPFTEDPATHKQWWYATDPTHLCFYNDHTWTWLSNTHPLKIEYQSNPVIILRSLIEVEKV